MGLVQLLANGIGIHPQACGHLADGQPIPVAQFEDLAQGGRQRAQGPLERLSTPIPERLRLHQFEDGRFDAINQFLRQWVGAPDGTGMEFGHGTDAGSLQDRPQSLVGYAIQFTLAGRDAEVFEDLLGPLQVAEERDEESEDGWSCSQNMAQDVR